MRILPICAAALIVGGLGLGLRANDAQAAPLPAMTSLMTSLSADSTAVEKVAGVMPTMRGPAS